MSFLPADISTALVSQFRGAIPSPDSYAVDPSHSLYCRNCSFVRGNASLNQVQTRLGHSQVVQLPNGDGSITAMYNWYFTSGGSLLSLVMYYAPSTGGKYYNQTGGAFALIFPVTGAAGAIFVGAGQRIYAAFYNSNGQIGAAGAQVYGWGIGADPLFAEPLTTPTLVLASAPAGLCTVGQHLLAYITTTRNGYTGTLQPIQLVGSSYTVAPISVSSGIPAKFNLSLTFGSLPSDLTGGSSSIQIVMTTVANQNRWYAVPGAIFTPAVGANTVSVNISDDTLTATATDVTDRLNLLVTLSGTPPFKPVSIFKYSSRMGYCTVDSSGSPVIYVSNQNDFQYITADQHAIYLEGEAIPIAGVSLHVLYIAATTGFYTTVDNGDVPATWNPPQHVDGSVGIISPTCLLENSTSGYVLVASPGSGLYVFGGTLFPALPVSYHQKPDWDRINWTRPTQIQLAEDVLTKKFLVMAPLNCTITNVSNTNPLVVTTDRPHLYPTGLSVTITGVLGTYSANTTATVTSLSDTQFSIAVAGNGAYLGGGLVSPNAPNAVMSWDYTEGYDPESVKYSLRSFTSFLMGAIARVFNTGTSIQEVWYAPATTNPGGLIRQMMGTEPTPYRDADMSGAYAAINSLYQTSNLPGSQDESNTLHDYHGAHLRVSGNGSLALKALGLDGGVSVTPAASPITLSPQAAKELLVKWWLRSEQQTIQFGTNAVDANFILSLVRAYFTESLPQR